MKLLITREELLERTPLGGNIDNDKITPHILTAQDIHVQNILGTKLYDDIVLQVEDGSIAGDNLLLWEKYIKPVLCHYAASDFYLFHAYTIANGGVYRHQSENSFTPDLSEVQVLHDEQKNKAVHYRSMIVDFLCHYSYKYPAYTEYQEAGLYPDRGIADNQWTF